MPYEKHWVYPAMFLEHGGIRIYHCYEDDDVQERLIYWYTTSQEKDDREKDFEVRDLMYWNEDTADHFEEAKRCIRLAIDNNIITQNGYLAEEDC